MIPKIKFGTDGWRGVIADDFTFANIAKVALATANFYLRHKKIKNGIVIGYDSRFLSREFAEKVAEVLTLPEQDRTTSYGNAASQIQVILS